MDCQKYDILYSGNYERNNMVIILYTHRVFGYILSQYLYRYFIIIMSVLNYS